MFDFGRYFNMVMNESVENYLETILVLNHRLGNVRSIDIANEMCQCRYEESS